MYRKNAYDKVPGRLNQVDTTKEAFVRYFPHRERETAILRPDTAMVELTRKLFPRFEVWADPVADAAAMDLPNFDAIVLVPACERHKYGLWFDGVYQACFRQLASVHYSLDQHLETVSSRHVQLQPDAALVEPRTMSSYVEPLAIDFGGRGSGISTEVATPQLLVMGNRLLEPGAALLAITQLALRGLIAYPMRVECSGTMYSPKGNDRFDDVLRLDVQPPTCYDPGFVVLDWNRASRARGLHGVGSARHINLQHPGARHFLR